MSEQRKDTYLADIMCKRKGKKEGLPTPPNYWNNDEWKVEFKKQILGANRLLKIYPFEVIVAAVNGKRGSWIYSLYSPALTQILREENAKYERKIIREEIIKEKLDTKEKSIQIDKAPEIIEEKKSLRSLLD